MHPRASTCLHVPPRAPTCLHVRPRAFTCPYMHPRASTRLHVELILRPRVCSAKDAAPALGPPGADRGRGIGMPRHRAAAAGALRFCILVRRAAGAAACGGDGAGGWEMQQCAATLHINHSTIRNLYIKKALHDNKGIYAECPYYVVLSRINSLITLRMQLQPVCRCSSLNTLDPGSGWEIPAICHDTGVWHGHYTPES